MQFLAVPLLPLFVFSVFMGGEQLFKWTVKYDRWWALPFWMAAFTCVLLPGFVFGTLWIFLLIANAPWGSILL